MSNSANDADRDFIAAALPAFISEAVEQTDAVETLLLELEEHPDDRDMLDSLGHPRTHDDFTMRNLRRAVADGSLTVSL